MAKAKPYYVVVAPERAKNGSTNEPAIFRFEAANDDAARAYLKSYEGKDRMRSGGVNWSAVAELVKVDGDVRTTIPR